MINHWEEALYKQKGETLERNYLNDKKKIKNTKLMLNYVEKMVQLNSSSLVLEIGCNLARNLREVYSRYGCRVVGCDINKECIEKCQKHFGDKGIFVKCDLRDLSFFKQYKDNAFDLGLSMDFLLHIPQGDLKKEMMREFLRICKNACLFEMFIPGKKDYFEDNQWSASFEDYRIYNKNFILTDINNGSHDNYRLFFIKTNNP